MIYYESPKIPTEGTHTVETDEDNGKYRYMPEVIVIGCGPAGVSAALELYKSGIKTLAVDSALFPRRKVCAGGLMFHAFNEFPWIRPYIESYIYGLTVYAHDCGYAFSVHSEDKDRPIMAVTPSRTEFDNAIFGFLKNSGCPILTGVRVIDVKESSEGVKIRLKRGAGTVRKFNIDNLEGEIGIYEPNGRREDGLPSEFSLYTRFVIAGDSAVSTTARSLGIGAYSRGTEYRNVFGLGMEYNFGSPEIGEVGNPNNNRRENGLEVFLYLYYGSLKGYAWVFPRRNYINIGVGAQYCSGNDLRKVLDKFTDMLIGRNMIPPEEKPVPEAAVLPVAGPYKKFFSDRCILVGDAGGFCSPATGEGIYYALKSGKRAARLIKEIIRDKGRKRRYRTIRSANPTAYFSDIIKDLHFQYYVKETVLTDPRRCIKAIRWGMHDRKLRNIFGDFLTGRIETKSLPSRMLYHYFRCKILDIFGKLGNKRCEEKYGKKEGLIKTVLKVRRQLR